MESKLLLSKNLVFLLATVFMALFVGLSFVNIFVSAVMLMITVIVIVFGVLLYGVDINTTRN